MFISVWEYVFMRMEDSMYRSVWEYMNICDYENTSVCVCDYEWEGVRVCVWIYNEIDLASAPSSANS